MSIESLYCVNTGQCNERERGRSSCFSCFDSGLFSFWIGFLTWSFGICQLKSGRRKRRGEAEKEESRKATSGCCKCSRKTDSRDLRRKSCFKPEQLCSSLICTIHNAIKPHKALFCFVFLHSIHFTS